METFRNLLGLPTLRALVLFRVSFSFGKMAVTIFLPILARTEFGINAFAIGWILAGGKLTKSLLQGYIGNLTDRIGHRAYFVASGALLYGLGTALIPLSFYFEGTVTPVRFQALGEVQRLGGAFFSLFLAYALLGVADSLRLPASMALFVEEGEKFDSVASAMSLRSIGWKVGQITGPVLVGGIIDYVSITAAFLTAAGFIVLATGGFVFTYRRAERTEAAEAALGD